MLDASKLGDVPAVYRVPQHAPHQMPVIGVYIDPRVRTGFRYKVRPMQVRPVIEFMSKHCRNANSTRRSVGNRLIYLKEVLTIALANICKQSSTFQYTVIAVLENSLYKMKSISHMTTLNVA